MAYEIASGANANCPNGCPIQLHFTNPQVEFQAFPGAPTGTLAGDAQGRHSVNARTAVLYAPAVERFRGPVKTDKGIFGHGFESLPDIVCNPGLWANSPQ